ncbi:hypothetical protein [Nonomuraea sp. NPDC050643]
MSARAARFVECGFGTFSDVLGALGSAASERLFALVVRKELGPVGGW